MIISAGCHSTRMDSPVRPGLPSSSPAGAGDNGSGKAWASRWPTPPQADSERGVLAQPGCTAVAQQPSPAHPT